jgi:hypothetical protein
MTTLPTSLIDFREELEAAVAREQLRRSRRRRRVVLRLAVVTSAVGVLTLGAFAALPGDSEAPFVEPASAARRAAAALAATPGAIVHIDSVVEQQNPDGSHISWRTESWQRSTPPYDLRQIVTGANGVSVESATVDGRQQLYDPQSNSVLVMPSDSTVGTLPGNATPQPASAQPFRDQVVDLLRGGKLTESGRASVDGRRTVSFVWEDGRTRYEYTVEAGTYDPVRWRFASTDSSSETTVTFDTYELVDADRASLDLTRRYPDARVHRR